MTNEGHFDKDAGRATTHYDVRVTQEKPSAGKMAKRHVWTLLANFVEPLSWLPYAEEPKLECHVEVVRKSDGSVAVTYDHTVFTEAVHHAESIRDRLASMSNLDFDKDLGIGSALE